MITILEISDNFLLTGAPVAKVKLGGGGGGGRPTHVKSRLYIHAHTCTQTHASACIHACTGN